jgi:chemosensory pili system protein ChpA (sensor histidine kinase/response regulator)
MVRVRSGLLDRLVGQAGEVMITRSRLDGNLIQMRVALGELTANLEKLRRQLRDVELQAEVQMQSRLAQSRDIDQGFDPLEFDRFTRVQELTRMMAESVNDVATVQRTLERSIDASEGDLAGQMRQTRELQRDLLRTRMVEFESISERLYRVVRLAAKDSGKQVRLDITGGSIEMDRGVLERMAPAFEHLLRNGVGHGIEAPGVREAAGKSPVGTIAIDLRQEGNEVLVEFRDDGAGLNLERIQRRAVERGLMQADVDMPSAELAQMIFEPGFSTAEQVTELSGRGIGMDVVRSEVTSLGGRIEIASQTAEGSRFGLHLPLTTAVTQIVLVRAGNLSVGAPATVVELVLRYSAAQLEQAYRDGSVNYGGETIPFHWAGALLQASEQSQEPAGKTSAVVVFRSASQRVAVHVDDVLGNQEVVIKKLGAQLVRLPGLSGMTALASGAVVLIYNPVALAAVYGERARRLVSHALAHRDAMAQAASQASSDVAGQGDASMASTHDVYSASGQALSTHSQDGRLAPATMQPAAGLAPLVLVVDDSVTVRRVSQRLLLREGYRVTLASDGLQAIEKLAEERPALVLSDIEMPRMDGFDLVRNIRQDASLAGMPVIMITSRIAEKHREHARELGVNHYLGKPFVEDDLMRLVRQYAQPSAVDVIHA